MPRRLLVVITAEVADDVLGDFVRGRAGSAQERALLARTWSCDGGAGLDERAA
jgi:hypothetical protein